MCFGFSSFAPAWERPSGKFPTQNSIAGMMLQSMAETGDFWGDIKGERLNRDPEKLVTAATFRS
jgi:hypothetical protein